MKRRPAGGLIGVLQRLERRVGADRPGRSGYVWLFPLATATGTFVFFMVIATYYGDLDWTTRLPVAIVGTVVVGGLGVAYLAAFGIEAREADEEEAAVEAYRQERAAARRPAEPARGTPEGAPRPPSAPAATAGPRR